MAELAGHPYIEVEITKDGALYDPGDLERAEQFIDEEEITDLVVISHGWNNHKAEARELYEDLFESLGAVAAGGSVDLGTRKIGVMGILWPSKKFTDKDLIPGGGAASAGGDQPGGDVEDRLDDFAAALDDPGAVGEIDAVRASIADLQTSSEARELFADKIRALLPGEHRDSDDGSEKFLTASPQDLFDRLKTPFLPPPSGSAGGGAMGGVMGGAAGGVMGGATGGVMGGAAGGPGGAAGLGDWFNGVNAAARRILNYATYYVMKGRAGTVGAGAVRQLVAAVKAHRSGTKVHLVGHSFGGRVVTAAAKALGGSAGQRPSSMSLLQAAFSHNGFAKNFHAGENGYFRSVMSDKVVQGPVLVTHTHNDKANALAYPLASRLVGADAASVGGPNDRFGAIGANGAQHTPEVEPGTLLGEAARGYSFVAGRLYNLEAGSYIGDHGDVTGREVALAILSAISST